MSELDTCTICGSSVPGDGHAIGVSSNGVIHFVPFVEDLRTSALGLQHVECFVKANGLAPFLEALHEHNERMRALMSEYRQRAEAGGHSV